MGSFLKALAKEGIVNFVALIVLILLVWFGGEYLGWDTKLRVLIIVGILVLWLLLYVVQRVLAVRAALLIEKRLRAQAEEQADSVRPDKKPEIQALEKQLSEAIQALKRSRLGSRALYSLPWYVIIGPPGSGKTTALQESGLNFPHVSQGRKEIRGVGGTRNCDWSFTDQGILLDTAGRYTTELEDRDEWLAFLDMVRKCRKRKPINGVIVAVSIAEILAATDEVLEAHAKNIRDRVDELTKRLELIFPVYLVFTKCDLLSGFVEFFEDFGKSDRAQVWGYTLPYPDLSGRSPQATFEEETTRLYGALCSQRAAALANDRPLSKKQKVYSFPLQFALARQRLGEFVGAVFRPNPYQESAVLRGSYFTSGTQEGTPIDQVVAAMGRAFGLKGAASLVQPVLEKKSYFINHLFTKIIFPDQELARSSSRAARRRRLGRYALATSSVAAFVLLAVFLLVSFSGNKDLLHSVGAAIHDSQAETSPDLDKRLSVLDELRSAVKTLDDHDRESLPIHLRFGLYRGDDVNATVRKSYFEGLRKMFVEPCGARLEADLKKELEPGAGNEKLFDLYRAYKIMGGDLAPDPDLLSRVLAENGRWVSGLTTQGAAPPADTVLELAKRQLALFTSQVGRIDAPRIRLDSALIARVTPKLGEKTWIGEAFQKLVKDFETLPKVTKDRFVKGAHRDDLVVEKEFSSFFTQDGWDHYAEKEIEKAGDALSDRYKQIGIIRSASEIGEELRSDYERAYLTSWHEYVTSTKPREVRDLKDVLEVIGNLSADASSPYPAYFDGIQKEQGIRLSMLGKKKFDLPSDTAWLGEAMAALRTFKGALGEFVGATAQGKRFLPFTEDKKARLEKLGRDFADASAGIGRSVAKINDLGEKGCAEEVLLSVLGRAREAIEKEARQEASQKWSSDVSDVFQKDFAKRYPFDPSAPEEVPLATFSGFFKTKSGTLWKVYDDLARLKAIAVFGSPVLSYSDAFDTAVDRAARIRDALYREDGSLSLKFWVTMKKTESSQEVADISFELGNVRKDVHSSSTHRYEFTWTDADPRGAKVSVKFVSGQEKWRPRDDFADKDWGLFRLIAAGSPKCVRGKTYECTWKFPDEYVGATPITLEVRCDLEAEPTTDPFQPDFFSAFQCPQKVGD